MEEGKVREESDLITAGSAEALHGLLGVHGDAPGWGGELPPLWHWLAFLPRVPQSDLGQDGHPRRGPETKPDEFPQRMFAGAEIRFYEHAHVGAVLSRQSWNSSIEEKSGRSGPLLFTAVEHIVREAGHDVVRETQHIAYRPATRFTGVTPFEREQESGEAVRWEESVEATETLLFRFSALTYNAHRIHFDRPYAVDVEGYPGLVVQGPLIALLLAELCRRHFGEREISEFRFRAHQPLFDGETIRLRGSPVGEDRAEMYAAGEDGKIALRANAIFR